MRSILFAAIVATSASLPAGAHEFWLEPNDFTPKAGVIVPISIRIGQNFKGNSYPYLREDFKTFTVTDPRGTHPVKGIDGDDPAVTMKFQAGLNVMVHYSTAETLNFETWEKFDTYLRFEGLEHIFDLHSKRGLPRTGIVEIYYRCAKLLLAVGGGGGEDHLTGMPLELVAEKNPYRLAAGEALPLRLYLNRKPVAGIQIAAMSKSDPKNRLTVRTDADGRAQLTLPAAGPWLLNAVVMEEPRSGEKSHWTSLWASLTFARP